MTLLEHTGKIKNRSGILCVQKKQDVFVIFLFIFFLWYEMVDLKLKYVFFVKKC